MYYIGMLVAILIGVLLYRLTSESSLRLLPIRHGFAGKFQLLYAFAIITIVVVSNHIFFHTVWKPTLALPQPGIVKTNDDKSTLSDALAQAVTATPMPNAPQPLDANATTSALATLEAGASAIANEQLTNESEIEATSQALSTQVAMIQATSTALAIEGAKAKVTNDAHIQETPTSQAVEDANATANAELQLIQEAQATATYEAQALNEAIMQQFADAEATVKARATGASVKSTATAQTLVLSEAIQKNFADAQATVEARATGASVQSTATAQVQATHDAIKKGFADAQATVKARTMAQTPEDAHATETAQAMSTAAQSFANTQATIQAQATSDSITKAFSNAQATGEARATATAAAKATSDAIKNAFAESNQRPIYHTLSLSSIANKSTEEGYKSPPFGRIELARVLFDMPRGQNSATTQAEGLPDFPTTLALFNINISHAKTVYLLITGGSTRNIFEGSTIGSVTFYFTNNQTYSQPIIPGWNIREWKDCCNPNVIHTDDPTVQEVWRSENNFDNGTATIDMWTIEIPENYRQQTLETIEITDRSTSAVGSKNPAINLLGMTVMSQE